MGRIGPYQEQINSAYSGTSLEDKVLFQMMEFNPL